MNKNILSANISSIIDDKESSFTYESLRVTVIIPVYNGFEVTLALLDSLYLHYSKENPSIDFIIIDDCSPDPQIQKLLCEHPFSKVSNVKKIRNKTNQRFVGSVNLGISLSDSQSDIILLNSDTVIFSDFISELQKTTRENFNVGTVTAMTNNCTIASLFDFPNGSDIPKEIDVKKLGKVISELDLPTVLASAPTGVGFCMYITREMLDSVGSFDPIFHEGYGEENDLCQRARKKGFNHFIASNCFVQHQHSASFGVDVRQHLVEKQLKIINHRYPNYSFDVQRYIHENPLALHRVIILTEYFLQKETEIANVIHILHASPVISKLGGTERHVDQLVGISKNQLCLTIGSDFQERFIIEIKFNDFSQSELLKESELFFFLNRYLSIFENTHLHHWIRVSTTLQQLIFSKAKRLILSIHDFYLICPSVNLLTGVKRNQFCGVELNMDACNKCLKENYTSSAMPMEIYRAKSARFLQRADKIIFPSENTLNYFLKAFPFIKNKSNVFSHSLNHLQEVESPHTKLQKDSIVFVGVISSHKGADVVIKMIKELSHRYDFFLAGEIAGEIAGKVSGEIAGKIVIHKYKTSDELFNIFEKTNPSFAIFASIWPETFCYTFFETLIMSNAIPVVGPYGHPFDIVQKHGAGVSFDSFDVKSIEEAIRYAKNNQERILNKISQFRKEILANEDYPQNYLKLLNEKNRRTRDQKNRALSPEVKNLMNLIITQPPVAQTSFVRKLLVRLAKSNQYIYFAAKKSLVLYRQLKKIIRRVNLLHRKI